MGTRFNYNQFFRYYTNPRNVTREPLPRPTVQFYHDNQPVPFDASLGATSITINNTPYYIQSEPRTKKIRFSTPVMFPSDPGVLWDNHYTFGIKKIKIKNHQALAQRQIGPSQQYQNVVFFHKTYQEPWNGNKRHENCYFFPDELIDDIRLIPDIDCLQSTTSKMTRGFPLGSEDLKVITELIRRPFYGRFYGGHRRTKKSRRSVHRTRRQRPV
jgi:hypothetical protein